MTASAAIIKRCTNPDCDRPVPQLDRDECNRCRRELSQAMGRAYERAGWARVSKTPRGWEDRT